MAKHSLGKLILMAPWRLGLPILRAVAYSGFGALVVLIVVFVLFLETRTDLQPWHLLELEQQFRADQGVDSFADYLALEERLFAELDSTLYQKLPSTLRHPVSRYTRDSMADPQRWAPNWNRSFEWSRPSPRLGVLLIHGMSDAPYSLRTLGELIHAAGGHVIGLRVPGHGTVPSGLVTATWEDMDAAVALAMNHLAAQVPDGLLYLVGYSNGAALAVHHAIASLEEPGRPRPDGLVLISPAIGVSPVAFLAVWQARLGYLLGLDKLSWNSILPEYDPYQYKSFAVNAGDVVYRLTSRIQAGLRRLEKADRLEEFPPVLAFSSVVDATVSVPALVRGLFARLPRGAHELVLFDVNHQAGMDDLFNVDPMAALQRLRENPDRNFTLGVVTNHSGDGPGVRVDQSAPGEATVSSHDLGMAWPTGVFSLSHIALPFPPDDPVYGERPGPGGPGIHLGDLALRGERGVLRVSATEMLRLHWNPFFPYLLERTMGALGLAGTTGQ